MNTLWAAQIPYLPVSSLVALAMDAEQRIGSHVAGGNPVDEYVEGQRYLLSLIQDELGRRG